MSRFPVQRAAFDIDADPSGVGIPPGESIAINLKGGINDHGSQHQRYHVEMERFWRDYRRGGRFELEQVDTKDYNRAVTRALAAAGVNAKDRVKIMALVRAEQAYYKVGNYVKRVPNAIQSIANLL